VQDVFCLGCNDRIGWYYFKASDSSQKYKEGMLLASLLDLLLSLIYIQGKFLLEREKLVKENKWVLDE